MLCAALSVGCGSVPSIDSSPQTDSGASLDAAPSDTGGDSPVIDAPDVGGDTPPSADAVDDAFSPDPAQRFRCQSGAPRLAWDDASGCTDAGATIGGVGAHPFLCTFVKATVAGDLYCLPSLSGSVEAYADETCSGASSTPPIGFLDATSWHSTPAPTGGSYVPQIVAGTDADGFAFVWHVSAESAPATSWTLVGGACSSSTSPVPVNDEGYVLRAIGGVPLDAFYRFAP